MSALKLISAFVLVSILSAVKADEVSKRICAGFLPAFGDQNIDLINNGFKRDHPENEKSGKLFFSILKAVSDDVSAKAQERCDKSIYPVMDLKGCYDKCKEEAAKAITGSFAWNVQDRNYFTNQCYTACTGAYVAQNAITKTMRAAASDKVQCAETMSVFDSRKEKQIERVLHNVPGEDKAAVQK